MTDVSDSVPAPMVQLPAETVEKLRAEVETWEESGRAHDVLSIRAVSAARALLDSVAAVAEVQRDDGERAAADKEEMTTWRLAFLEAEAERDRLKVRLDEVRGPHDGGWFWSQAEWSDWSNRLAELLPERYDGDEAQEAIIERALAELVDAATPAASVPAADNPRGDEGEIARLRRENDELKAQWGKDVSSLESMIINDEASFRRLRKAFEDKDAEANELRIRYEHVERENAHLQAELDSFRTAVPAADILALADDIARQGAAAELPVDHARLRIAERLRALVAAAEQADKGEAADTPRDEEAIKCPTCGVARGWNEDGRLTRGIWTLNCVRCGSFQIEIEDAPAAPVGEPPCKCGHGPDDHDSEGICCRVHPDFPLRLIPCVDRVPVNDEAEAQLWLIRNSKTGKWFMGSVGGDDGIWAKNIAMSVVYTSSESGPVYGLPEDGEWVRFRAARQGGNSDE